MYVFIVRIGFFAMEVSLLIVSLNTNILPWNSHFINLCVCLHICIGSCFAFISAVSIQHTLSIHTGLCAEVVASGKPNSACPPHLSLSELLSTLWWFPTTRSSHVSDPLLWCIPGWVCLCFCVCMKVNIIQKCVKSVRVMHPFSQQKLLNPLLPPPNKRFLRTSEGKQQITSLQSPR